MPGGALPPSVETLRHSPFFLARRTVPSEGCTVDAGHGATANLK